jgi:hypothetical protein
MRTANTTTLECADLAALLAGDLSPSNMKALATFHKPLNAALSGRQVGQTGKAMTGHRTPKLRGGFAF